MSDESSLAPGRTCEGCTMCCKLMGISEIAKPKAVWCPHCDIGKGCRIYDTRPDECRSFYCGYRQWRELGEHWTPASSKLVVAPEMNGSRIAVHVDPGSPSAWRKEPYFSEIKAMAAGALERSHSVVICIGRRVIVIFPDREVDLGPVADDETVVTGVVRRDGTVIRTVAERRKADDPELKGIEPGTVASRPVERR